MAEPVIDVQNLSKSFGKKHVVDDLSLKINKGEVFGFLGPNGSGKTTTIRMLCGLLHPDGGSGTCLGSDILKQAEQIKPQIGYMTQHFSLYTDLSVQENLQFVAQLYEIPNPKQAVAASLETLGISQIRSRQLAGELSGGWQQRLALAAATLHQPKLLLLDEPTAGVDPKARRDFWDTIHRLAAGGVTALVSTHYMDEAERCHRLAYIAYGSLLAHGTQADIIEQIGITTFSVKGDNLFELSERLESESSIEQVVNFGNSLHVSSFDIKSLEQLLSTYDWANLTYEKIETQLEDIFIYLMKASKDNLA